MPAVSVEPERGNPAIKWYCLAIGMLSSLKEVDRESGVLLSMFTKLSETYASNRSLPG